MNTLCHWQDKELKGNLSFVKSVCENSMIYWKHQKIKETYIYLLSRQKTNRKACMRILFDNFQGEKRHFADSWNCWRVITFLAQSFLFTSANFGYVRVIFKQRGDMLFIRLGHSRKINFELWKERNFRNIADNFQN